MNSGERARRGVVEPLSLVFAYVARDRGGSLGHEGISVERAAAARAAAERAAAELDRRYPEGVDGLRGGYVLLRRGLVCMGLPRECGEGAVAWTGYVPRRLRLRRRAVVLRRFADSIGYVCLRRGVPVELGGRMVPEGELLPPEHRDDVLARLPAEFAAAPRYLLVGRGARSAVAAGMRPIRERRRPSLVPVLSGARRPRRRLRALAVANLLVALALVAAVVTASTRQTATPETGGPRGAPAAGAREPGVRAAGTGRPRTAAVGSAAARGEDAAVALGALGRALEPLSPRLDLHEIRAEGAALRVRATGGDAESVQEALDVSTDFENVVTVSRRESGFVIEARYHGRRYSTRRYPDRSESVTRPSDTGGVRAATLLEDAGAEGIAFERVDPAGGTASATGREARYRIRAEASAEATAEALVGLTAAERGISVAALSLTRAGRARWRMTAVVHSGEVAEE